MIRLARRASLLVAFFLLTLTATAYADCAWVLWQQQAEISPGGSVSSSDWTWLTAEATSTEAECRQASARFDTSLTVQPAVVKPVVAMAKRPDQEARAFGPATPPRVPDAAAARRSPGRRARRVAGGRATVLDGGRQDRECPRGERQAPERLRSSGLERARAPHGDARMTSDIANRLLRAPWRTHCFGRCFRLYERTINANTATPMVNITNSKSATLNSRLLLMSGHTTLARANSTRSRLLLRADSRRSHVLARANSTRSHLLVENTLAIDYLL
jgi:hypothetical protein